MRMNTVWYRREKEKYRRDVGLYLVWFNKEVAKRKIKVWVPSFFSRRKSREIEKGDFCIFSISLYQNVKKKKLTFFFPNYK